MNRPEKRDLAFQVRFNVIKGRLIFKESEVGQISGQLVVQIPAHFQPFPPPGQYLFTPPESGSLPDTAILETMGYLDAAALVDRLEMPEAWREVPAELVDGLSLEAELEFAGVEADDEYEANEPADLEEAKRRFEGRWRLVVELPLEGSFPRDGGQVTLDRFEFELDCRFAQLIQV